MSPFGTALPVIQAPMAGVQGARLAIAVCEAGGLGSLPAAMLSPDALRRELLAIRAATDRRFNINFFCHQAPSPDAARETQWRQRLSPYLAEFGIDPASIGAGPGRQPFNDELADVIAEFEPPIVSFHFGLPTPELVARVKRWGAQVWSSATTVEEARWLQAQGADAVIAQGLEAGGHRGHFLSADLSRQLGLFALLPQIRAAVSVPVIAAGGIADAAGVRAALALGAQAAQVGSAYLLSDEADTSAIHRGALQGPAAAHTALTHLFTGRPARSIVNRLMRELGPLSEPVPAFPLATGAIAPLRAAAEARGLGDFSPLWAGQNVSRCSAGSAAEITRSLAP